MREKLDHISPKAMNDAVNEAWRLLATAIELRDNLGVSAEVKRVARALCHSNGNNSDDYVIVKPHARFGLKAVTLYTGNVMLAWRDYVDMAKIVITNLDRGRQEEADRLKQQEEAQHQRQTSALSPMEELARMGKPDPATDIPVGFSGMNEDHRSLANECAVLAKQIDGGAEGILRPYMASLLTRAAAALS